MERGAGSFRCVTGQPQYQQQEVEGIYYDTELPSVDDLEIAAAAAQAAYEEAQAESSAESDPSSESDTESSSEESSDEEDNQRAATAPFLLPQLRHLGKPQPSCSVLLHVEGSDGKVHLEITASRTEDGADHMDVEEEEEEDAASSVVSDMSDDVLTTQTQIRNLIDNIDADDEPLIAEDSAADKLPPPEPLDVEISPQDAVTPAGAISAVIEGIIVVQAPEQSPALREGSVLCLEDRKPLGRIEEILGPVLCPIYALRYAGDGGEMPAQVAPGRRVCSVDRFSHKLEEADLSAKGYDNTGQLDGKPEADDEVQFSDDEQEAEYRRLNVTKRKAGPAEEGLRGRGQGGRFGSHEGSRGGRPGGRGRGRGRDSSLPTDMEHAAFQASATAGQMMTSMRLDPQTSPGRGRGRVCSGLPSSASLAAPAGVSPSGGLNQSQAQGQGQGQQVVMPLEQALFLMDQVKQLQQQQQQSRGPQALPTSSQAQARHQYPPGPTSQQPWQQPPGLNPAFSHGWGPEGQPTANSGFSQAHFAGAPHPLRNPSFSNGLGEFAAPGAFSAPGSFEPPGHWHGGFEGQFDGMPTGPMQEGQSGSMALQQQGAAQWGQGQGPGGWAGQGYQAGAGIAPLGAGSLRGGGRSQQRGRSSRGRRGR
ncbi:hypothetical protein WJX74_010358 [Apatococcus lobatus]|uniref:H/ACA ribonucleoprotein complex non-core subunit NAF1 n=1 Tax=Apatococcus lobatus TaxID=904363 RepID=A0AAW1RF90_9CHLO